MSKEPSAHKKPINLNHFKSAHTLILGVICSGALLGGLWVIDSSDRIQNRTNRQFDLSSQMMLSDTAEAASFNEEAASAGRSFEQIYQEAVAFKDTASQKSSQKKAFNPSNFNINKPELPKGFNGKWQQVTMDEHVHIQALADPFTLPQTTDKLGHEFFYYDAYLFEQMASQVTSEELQQKLMALAANTKQMGDFIAQANLIKFDGAPTEKMTHLHVRSQMMFYLNGLNQSGLHLVDKSNRGDILKEKHPELIQIGPVLEQFVDIKQTLLSSQEMRQYPQIKALLKQEGERLKQLAENVHIHWETTFHCSNSSGSCQNSAINMKIYPRQNLTHFKMSSYDEILALVDTVPLAPEEPQALIAESLPDAEFP